MSERSASGPIRAGAALVVIPDGALKGVVGAAREGARNEAQTIAEGQGEGGAVVVVADQGEEGLARPCR